ncbi:MAG: D-lyxose/D-mannose family sugar isomerase [Candidatus Excrementavichristensenella sp.]|jgi:D-lyxose ketol-isomerase
MTNGFICKKQKEAALVLQKAGIALRNDEIENIEICDYELGRYDEIGTAIVIYANTERCCAKEMILGPHQLCPEHRHPPLPEYQYPGKEETFRCRWGIVYLYVEGEPVENPVFQPPEDKQGTFTVFHEIVLHPGGQYTLKPNTRHWFAAGSEGAIISEFSTPSYDLRDIFTDPEIIRVSNLDSEGRAKKQEGAL